MMNDLTALEAAHIGSLGGTCGTRVARRPVAVFWHSTRNLSKESRMGT